MIGQIGQLLQKYSLHGNWIDLMLIILIVYFMLTQKGFINTMLESLAFIFSLICSYKLYYFAGKLLILNFSFPNGIANAIGFFAVWIIAEIVFSVVILQILWPYIQRFHSHPLNYYLGFFAPVLQASIIFLFFVSFIFAFPVRGQIKQAILDSRTGPFFVGVSRSMETELKNVFGQAINESLNFLTIKPDSSETVNLGVKLRRDQLSADSQSEQTMLNLVNQERIQRGMKALIFDVGLRDLARVYGEEMFRNGFFSHVSAIGGTTPGDRATQVGIQYAVLGENLAFAPDVYVAHQGLMNSQGHRENILAGDYNRVGIGVIDGGIYGKIFVQEFSD